tara:strand:+ start:1210 stop:1347 length:138 start_codon:yes stop_codon:yes gene_type:complete
MKFVKRKPAVFKVISIEEDVVIIQDKDGVQEFFMKEDFEKEFEKV